MSGQRELYSESGVLSSFDGSASVCLGGSLAYSAVSGPGDFRSSTKERLYDQSALEIHSRSPLESGEALLYPILSSDYPRTHTAIHVQQGEDDGSYEAAAINAGTLSLMDSGIALRFLPGAVSLAISKEGDFILDPDKAASHEASSLFLFVFESKSHQLVSSSILKGRVSIKTFNKALKMAREASKSVFEFYRRAAEKKFSKD